MAEEGANKHSSNRRWGGTSTRYRPPPRYLAHPLPVMKQVRLHRRLLSPLGRPPSHIERSFPIISLPCPLP